MSEKMFKDLCGLAKALFKADDIMSQDELFECQERIAVILSENATGTQPGRLVKEFSRIFEIEYK